MPGCSTSRHSRRNIVTVTLLRTRRIEACAWCGRPLPVSVPGRAGRPREYCRRSCRQRAYENRSSQRVRHADEADLADERAAKEHVLDRLDVLARTLGDLERLEEGDDREQVLAWLVDAAREAVVPLSGLRR